MFEQEIALLAALIREAVTKYKEANPVPTRRHMRVRRRDFSLKYLEDFGFGNFTPERMEEDVWDWSDAEAFQRRHSERSGGIQVSCVGRGSKS